LPPEAVNALAVQGALIAYLGPEKGLNTWEWWMSEESPYVREMIARMKAVHAACTAQKQ
jgi:hypothetical protein